MPVLNWARAVTLGDVEAQRVYLGDYLVWPSPAPYLDAMTGTVTTPDPGPLPNECTFLFKVLDTLVASGTVSYQHQLGTPGLYIWYRNFNGDLGWNPPIERSIDWSSFEWFSASAIPITGQPQEVAVSMATTGFRRVWQRTSSQWEQVGPDSPREPAAWLATNVPVTIGGDVTRPCRIYWVELRTGLDPNPTGRYLTPTVGTVTTPDPGPLPAECTFVYKVRGPTTDVYNMLATQVEPDVSWQIFRSVPNDGAIFWNIWPDGAQYGPFDVPLTGTDETLALSWALNSGGRYQARVSSFDGTTWTLGSLVDVGAAVSPADVTSLVRVGGGFGGTLPHHGRIYSVELRTGLDPAAGTVLWRFDADEAPTDATTTTWTDPRGRTWTVTNPQAISGRTLWRFDASDFVPGAATAIDATGREWTATDPDAVVHPINEPA